MARNRVPLTALAALLVLPAAWGYQAESENEVYVGGTPIMRVRVASGGMSTSERATQIQARVNKFLGIGPIRPGDIVAQRHGNEAVVLVKGQTLFTADWATAKYNRTTPMLLAETWAEKMRAVLPGLTQPK